MGTEQDAHNVRRMFRDALRLVPGIDPDEWVSYELRPVIESGASVMDSVFPLAVEETDEDAEDEEDDDDDAA
ncbi:MAG: hypothetical protein M3306_09265 [Actinomycetota bacterium]|nr:hypothetical protein [Actinomycetota bacterium]